MILTFDIDWKKRFFTWNITTTSVENHFSTLVISTTNVQKFLKNDFLHHFVINKMIKYIKITNLNNKICKTLKVE